MLHGRASLRCHPYPKPDHLRGPELEPATMCFISHDVWPQILDRDPGHRPSQTHWSDTQLGDPLPHHYEDIKLLQSDAILVGGGREPN